MSEKNTSPRNETQATKNKGNGNKNKSTQSRVDVKRKDDNVRSAKKSGSTKKDIIVNIKKKPNYMLIAGILIILIPCIFLAYSLLGTHGNANEPVEGNRFKRSLDPEISEHEVSALKDSLTLEQVENIDISLKSATLRININANDDISQEASKALMNTVYEAAIAKFPVETYFTNKKNSDESIMKMYDLQVTLYNYIAKTDEEKEGQIQMIRTKNAAAESDVVDVVSSPKNPEVSENLINPDTSKIPESEGE